MINTYIWQVVPTGQPTVIRNCPKCGGHSEYECSQNFRVNANQSNIDVWLIYQCKKCKSTWNMEILSRVNNKTIDNELYIKFLSNNKELATYYSFDLATHSKNKSIPNYDTVSYDIIGNSISSLEECFQLEIACKYSLDIRLDKILSQKLCISREQIKKMCNTGRITGKEIKDITKIKLKNKMLLYFNQ